VLIGALLSLAMGWTLWRAWLPVGVAVPGRLLLEVPMGWRERWRWHRRSFYALAALMLLGAIGGWLPPVLQGAMALFAAAIFWIPIRYRLTTEGVAVNNVLFRRWEEFEGYRMEPWGIRLVGRGIGGSLRLYLPSPLRERTRAVVAGCLRRSSRRGAKSLPKAQEVFP